MAMSLVSSNTAGATKKSFTVVSLAICYAISNIIGPHFFLDSQKPYYELGIGTMMVAFVIMAICGGLYRYVCIRQNDACEQTVHYRLLQAPTEEQEDVGTNEPNSDQTDQQIFAFRYAY
ncbi:hypothetical protein G6514_003951 [Epicoccum nigrum]|nr:hypothetical protein G6514_003951 [Epicoccum nigrum]